jgi:hypothetical protein
LFGNQILGLSRFGAVRSKPLALLAYRFPPRRSALFAARNFCSKSIMFNRTDFD